MEPLVVMTGPTAVGKTDLSLPIARALQAEIVNVDSRQLYRYMDIGTAKPTPAQRAQVPHHLLDVLLPDQQITAAQFRQAATHVLDDMQRRRKRTLIVAGSGLYLRALLYGLMPVPAAHEPLRQELRTYADRYGNLALHHRLQRLDPEAAAQVHAHDRVRLVRALEVTLLTGEPFSTHQRRHRFQEPVYPYIGVAMTRHRTELYQRIADRTEAMLAAGWLAEVKTLVARGYTCGCAAMNSLGYRELLAYEAGRATWADTVTAIQTATRRFARRQLTWFRKFPHLHNLSLSALDAETAVVRILKALQLRGCR
ncbi:tRNA dimethylallyltransferase [Candidatus Entotheonellaceae bacterium PAL068K]